MMFVGKYIYAEVKRENYSTLKSSSNKYFKSMSSRGWLENVKYQDFSVESGVLLNLLAPSEANRTPVTSNYSSGENKFPFVTFNKIPGG